MLWNFFQSKKTEETVESDDDEDKEDVEDEVEEEEEVRVYAKWIQLWFDLWNKILYYVKKNFSYPSYVHVNYV